MIQWFSQTILSSQTFHYSFRFLYLPNSTPSNLLRIRPFIRFIVFLSTINWQNSSIAIPIQSPLLLLCSGLYCSCFKSFEHPIYSKSTFFHPNSFFSSQTHTLNSFTSYTVSCITNLDNSVHPFYPSSSSSTFSSFRTSYQSAFRMLCNTIHASFSTKNCTLPHILFQLITHFDSLRSASMRLSDKHSLHPSIPHHTAAQPALGTKSYHCSQIPFVFQNLLIGVCVEMLRSQWIAVCIDPIKKMICTSTDGLWMCLITFSSRFSPSNRIFGHLRCAKNARNIHIHQLHSLESTYYSCISHTRIRKILWWERCWSWVWWMWIKKWAWWRNEGEATARMVAFVESMMCAGRCSKSPTFGKSNERKNERITHRAGAEGIDRLHFIHQGLESG